MSIGGSGAVSGEVVSGACFLGSFICSARNLLKGPLAAMSCAYVPLSVIWPSSRTMTKSVSGRYWMPWVTSTLVYKKYKSLSKLWALAARLKWAKNCFTEPEGRQLLNNLARLIYNPPYFLVDLSDPQHAQKCVFQHGCPPHSKDRQAERHQRCCRLPSPKRSAVSDHRSRWYPANERYH